MPFALFIVTVPAKIAKKGKTGDPSSAVLPVASKVRNFIKEHHDCEWISEEPFLNGKKWWTSFMFTNKQATTEETVTELCRLGVGRSVAACAGKESTGAGIILVLPVTIQRVGTRPKVCGHPEDVPYGAVVSPPNSSPAATPTPTILKKKTISVHKSLQEESGDGAVQVDVDIDIDEECEIVDDDDENAIGSMFNLVKHGESAIKSFNATIQARVSVDSVIQYCHNASEFSFDYIMLIFNASVIACTGLVTNNTVVIVASMLVSPLMGPILAVTFGGVIESGLLVKRGIFSETMGLLMCILFGFIGGLCAAPVCGDTWPTAEMASRGIPSALWTGVAIAIPSGFGAALSVLGNNSSSLVGVAISASLLPPAVNCGILIAAWALWNTSYIDEGKEIDVNGTIYTFNDISAGISFCVTLINIVLILVCAYLMFMVKGLGSSNLFWNKHVKNVRKYNRAIRNSDERHHYEKAFLTAMENKAASVHPAPMEKTKASWKWDPFKDSGVGAPPASPTQSQTSSAASDSEP